MKTDAVEMLLPNSWQVADAYNAMTSHRKH